MILTEFSDEWRPSCKDLISIIATIVQSWTDHCLNGTIIKEFYTIQGLTPAGIGKPLSIFAALNSTKACIVNIAGDIKEQINDY